ncbi:hypothetical protein AAZX31_16G051300 [Glycine max]|uniref:Uncharacterized protein n=2 Tax=Glycine subgen. Soja TaxID=1462606 RepID=I1MLG2_SOYBN|nr:uncharacterized protein LOC100805879 [Glycine max]XP_028206623.1 uncharacterized protein LOC114390137 [Glycine soja]KAG4938340.1 hypothetical protein JHK86_044481 [Glycine max]KAG4940439.1 hypothetical protein JHK87_044310 [Glycine soja]KAG5101095.1 hypothetical protein JHK82_046147 [Glycine max]KAG5107683.1 hypothetical protein JHK84_044590 [Glycine max]KAH1150099.1 hypothetical protein GYH30_044236 [Glycine max]|eukprot:XP_003549150.1 uncharacterized protein LOC100805879 [Glycine max]
MEAYRKSHRGSSMRGKSLPFYRNAPKLASSTTVQYTTTASDIKTNHYSSSPASVGFVVHEDYATTKRNPKLRIVVADSRSNLDELYRQPADESVDTKAEIYIAMVQKRLMLER